MVDFPYIPILKKAFQITTARKWLWFFGLFIGGTTGINLGWMNSFMFPKNLLEGTPLQEQWGYWLNWISGRTELLGIAVAILVFSAVLFIVASGISKGAVVWTAAQEIDPDEAKKDPTLRLALKNSRTYLWSIIGLQILVTVGFVLLLVILAGPVIYLFAVQAVGRGFAALLLALLIFLPALVVFGFLHIYGPIFLVLYAVKIRAALGLSFRLLREKLKESVVLAAFLVGISFLFIFALIFSIILVSLPIALLALFLFKIQMISGLIALLIGTVVVLVALIVISSAAFAVFQNVTWVLAVAELVNSRKVPRDAQNALVAESAVN